MYNYKKIISLILALALCASMMFMFASCSLFNKGDEPDNGAENGGEGNNENQNPEEDNKDPEEENKQPENNTPAAPAVVTYTVTVKDADGNPIAANVKLVGADYFIPGKDTNAKGQVTFSVTEGEYTAQLTAIPEGFDADLSVKYEFDASYGAVIVLAAAAADAE